MYHSWEEKMGKPTPQNYTNYLQAYADGAWVYKCIAQIANYIASVPLKLYSKKNNKIEEIKNHVILDLLERVNNFMSFYDLTEITFSNLELTGNAYWAVERNVIGTPITPS